MNFYKLIESIGNSMLFRRKGIYASLNQVIKTYSYHFPHLLCSVITTLKNNQKKEKKEKISSVRVGLNWTKSLKFYTAGKESHRIKLTTFKYFPPLCYSMRAHSLSYVFVVSSKFEI